MKKHLLLFITVFLFSCSDHEENSIKNTEKENISKKASRYLPPVETAIDTMFFEYVNSDIFIEVNNLILEFNDDLNQGEKITELNTEEELLTWISNNIHLTKFNNVEEAVNRWIHIKDRKNIEFQKFKHVYQYIVSAPQSEVAGSLNKWLVTTPNVTVKGECEDLLLNCTLSASYDYMVTTAFAMSLQGGNNVRKAAITVADRSFQIRIETCGHTYNNCINSSKS